MSPPQGVSKTGSPTDLPAVTPAEERQVILSFDQFLIDTPFAASGQSHQYVDKWKSDRDYRLSHQKISEVIDYVTRFIKRDSSVSAPKLEAFLKAWYEDPKFKEDPLNAIVLQNIRGQLGKLSHPDNVEPATKVMGMLPPVEEPKQAAEAAPAPSPEKKADPRAGLIDPKKNLAIGLEFHNDSVPLAFLDVVGIPLSALATEKSYFTIKPSVEFPMGDWVGMIRLRGGMFEARGIPGENGKSGNGYRAGVDLGLVNPYDPDHNRAGVGLELTGVASHAGEASGIEAPGPVVRLRFWAQNDFNFPIGNSFELGFNTFFNDQETYLTIGNDSRLTNGGAGSPLATTSSLFARSPMRWFNVSGRYYINGRPDRDTAIDRSKPFRPGEGGQMVSALWMGQVINMNRREDIPLFANTQVLMGTFWPLGMESSMQQFDTINTGMLLFSLQDGYFIARNARMRGEIWRRDPTWVLRGLMLGGDALYLGYNIYRAATAKGDPPSNQTLQEFQQNPGSVTDFSGRAGKLNLMLAPIEYGLSALDASGLAGNVYDEDRTRYFATSGVAAGLGLLGFLFSGPLTGNGCAEDGPGGASVLFRCSFPAQRDKYFHTGINASPDNMQSFETQYMGSATFAALASWGTTRLVAPLSLSFSKPTGDNSTKAKKNMAATAPQIGVSLGPNGGQITYGGRF